MTEKELVLILKKAKIPLFYREFSSSAQIKPPYMVYYRENNDNIYADDEAYIVSKNMVVELYTEKKDFALEEKIEKIFAENGIICEIDEVYIPEEKIHEIIYEFQI